MLNVLFIVLLCGMALFMILLVLIQRGRGGGLSGAFGGAGGQSAFGAKAGDTFTKITMWTAFIWIVLCTVAALVLPKQGENPLEGIGGGAAATDTEGLSGAGPANIQTGGAADDGEAADPDAGTTGPPGTLTPSGTLETPDPASDN